jgi:beta-carotene 15,15'-dioxygenase
MTPNRGAATVAAPLGKRGRHRFSVLVTMCCALAAVPIAGTFDLAEFPLVAAGLIILFGLPHGALDIMVAGLHRNLKDRDALLGFLAQYVAVASTVAVTWWFFPGIALVGFLALSAIHFGGDWDDLCDRVGQATIGAALLASTTLLHQEQVSEIFGWLVPRTVAAVVTQALQVIAPIALAGAAVLLVLRANGLPFAVGEVAATLACAVVLPPITFFVLYFSVLHSVRHLCVTRDALRQHNARALIREGAPYALLAAIICLGGSAAFLHLGPGRALLSSVFVVLSALTVPHMLLVEWLRPRVSGC